MANLLYGVDYRYYNHCEVSLVGLSDFPRHKSKSIMSPRSKQKQLSVCLCHHNKMITLIKLIRGEFAANITWRLFMGITLELEASVWVVYC